MDFKDYKIETSELSVNYLREGQGPELILLHGWPEFGRTWKENIPALSEKFDVIVPELRGFGGTRRLDGKPDENTTVDILINDLKEFLDAMGIDRVAIVSHDVGAYVAQGFARSHPDQTAALFFFDCPYAGVGTRWGEATHLKEMFYQYFHQWPMAEELVGYNRDTCRIYFKHFLSHWAADPCVFDKDIELWVDNFMKPGNIRGGMEWYRGALSMRLKWITEGAPEVEPITCPTRVFWGEKDRIAKIEWADNLGDYFSNLKFSPAPDAGHFVHYEKPEMSNAEMRDFFVPLALGNNWK